MNVTHTHVIEITSEEAQQLLWLLLASSTKGTNSVSYATIRKLGTQFACLNGYLAHSIQQPLTAKDLPEGEYDLLTPVTKASRALVLQQLGEPTLLPKLRKLCCHKEEHVAAVVITAKYLRRMLKGLDGDGRCVLRLYHRDGENMTGLVTLESTRTDQVAILATARLGPEDPAPKDLWLVTPAKEAPPEVSENQVQQDGSVGAEIQQPPTQQSVTDLPPDPENLTSL